MSDFITIVEKPRNTHKPWAVRWRVDGHQHEKSFPTRKEAEDYEIGVRYRVSRGTYVDPKKSQRKFREAAEVWLTSEPRSPATLHNYRSVLRNHINPVFGDVPMDQVAHDVIGVRTFLNQTLPAKGVSASTVRTAKMIITGTVRDAIATGYLSQSRGAIIFGKGIKVPQVPTKPDIYFASHAELVKLADGIPEPYGLTVWIMRATGIRLGEVLAVKRENFANGWLRIDEQLNDRTHKYTPLKHRQAGQWRDIPCPDYLMDMLPDGKGYIFPKCGRTNFRKWWNKARDAAGLPKTFTPHSMRHIFASIALSEGVPITDVARWLGHSNITTTQAIYGHLVPQAAPRARAALDREYAEWVRDR